MDEDIDQAAPNMLIAAAVRRSTQKGKDQNAVETRA
jgi:hypothetical protein